MQSERCWVKFTHVIRHHLVVSMQGQPPSITGSQSEDERFSNLLRSNFWTMFAFNWIKRKTGGYFIQVYSGRRQTQKTFAAQCLLSLLNIVWYLRPLQLNRSDNHTIKIFFMQLSNINSSWNIYEHSEYKYASQFNHEFIPFEFNYKGLNKCTFQHALLSP